MTGPGAGSPASSEVTIALAGDTMLGRGVGAEVTTRGWRNLFSDEVRDITASADLVVLNLECCISARGAPWDEAGKLFHFRAPPRSVNALSELGVSCVTLANNHALDFGFEALTDTIDHLASAGVRATGAGTDAGRARAPARLTVGNLRICVLGVADHPASFAAGPDHPGVAYADLRDGVPAWLRDQVRAEAAGQDIVLVLPHWGPNMTTKPAPYIRSAARDLVEAGATLVAGTSAHVFHGVAGRVLYDLGDFIDDYATDPVLRNDRGLLFLVTLAGRQVRRVAAVPLKLDYARTEVASGADRAWIADRFARACAELGTTVRDEDGRLVAEPVQA